MSRVGITVEGGLLAADLVERIALGDETIAGQRPKDFDLEAGRLSAEIQSAFSDLRPFWEGFKRRREFSQTSPVTVTREAWVYPLFERLGYSLRCQRAATQISGQSYAISHRTGEAENATPVHTVGLNQRLDERGEQRRSPHALLQEYLNRGDALWGIVTNGRELRLLRNSARSSRPSYVAIDLETILDSNLYNEFALVFRLLHRSRLSADGGDPHQCLLETWYQQGIDEGGRVRDRLRDGVKAALETLGSGFLGHPANTGLRTKLETAGLIDLQLYRELLNLIYRLLFLMVAEERQFLFVPEAGAAARHEVYLRWYGIGRLRDRAEHRSGEDAYGDLWEGLKETFRLFRDEAAAKALALTALNGELFGLHACIDLEDRNTSLRNSDLLDAIRQLSTFEERTGRKKTGVQRRVNYAGLDVEELGSIYESLLDYHPQVLRDPWRFALAAGSERKATGSYYTPPELVRELIESALVPVMEARRDAAKTKEERERALLSLTICDPAAGSGHFLLAAARRIGRELAMIRSGEAEPAPETYRAALRDVIRRCVYAVDKNPLAIDLCKVALWIEGHAPGLPLSFLDHRIRCGDSLVGVLYLDVVKAGVPDAAFKPLTGDDKAVCLELRRINKRDRETAFGTLSAEEVLADLAGKFAALADMPDQTPSDVRSKAGLYRELIEGEGAASGLRRACDAWTAAFFASRATGHERAAPTTADVWNALNGRENPQRTAIIEELSERFHFFHWRLEFPEVFVRGGFDVMLGNPPWERIKLQEQEFFTAHDREIAEAPNKAAREQLIKALFLPDASLAQQALGEAFKQAKHAAEAEAGFARHCGRFPLSAVGDINTYALFAETFLNLLGALARAGLFVPISIATDSNAGRYFAHVIQKGRLKSLKAFFEVRQWFLGTDDRKSFAAFTLGSPSEEPPDFMFDIRTVRDLADDRRRFSLTPDDIELLNPNTHTCPVFRSRADAELTKQIYRRVPVLVDEGKGKEGNPWGIAIRQGLFHLTNDIRDGIVFDASGQTIEARYSIPLTEGKMFNQFDHRWSTYLSNRSETRELTQDEKGSDLDIQYRYWSSRDEFAQRILQWKRKWLMVWRDITHGTNERTIIASAIPRMGVSYTARVVSSFAHDGRLAACFLANLNSLVCDFIARQSVGGAHLSDYIIKQLCILPPTWYGTIEQAFVVSRVLELRYTSGSLTAFARDLDYDGPQFHWDPDRRALLKAELDAYFAYLYGLSRDELRYMLDPKEVMGADYPSETFRVLKENEIRAYGEYRTRRLVLEAWDRFAEDGTFDPARLQDPTHFDMVRRALVETRGRVGVLERERDELMALLKRSDATPLPTLFVEGESDVGILTAAWQAFHPTEPLPVTILAAGGTRQMESLAGKGRALRQVLGDRLVFALADNDREGRELVEDGRTRRGGTWRQQSNGIYWCLLAPTAEFEQAMKRFRIDAAYWPSTIENAFPAALRRQAIAEGAYRVEEGRIQAAFLEEPSTAVKALDAVRDLDRTDDEAALYFRPPDPETKLVFAGWVAAPAHRDRATFAAFGPILDGLRAILAAASRGRKAVNGHARENA
jgi:hypothetical protein